MYSVIYSQMHDLSELRTFYKNYSGCLTYRDLEVSLYKLWNSPGPVSRRLPFTLSDVQMQFLQIIYFPWTGDSFRGTWRHSAAALSCLEPVPLYTAARECGARASAICMLARSAAHTASASSKRKTCEPFTSAGNTERYCCCCAFL